MSALFATRASQWQQHCQSTCTFILGTNLTHVTFVERSLDSPTNYIAIWWFIQEPSHMRVASVDRRTHRAHHVNFT